MRAEVKREAGLDPPDLAGRRKKLGLSKSGVRLGNDLPPWVAVWRMGWRGGATVEAGRREW